MIFFSPPQEVRWCGLHDTAIPPGWLSGEHPIPLSLDAMWDALGQHAVLFCVDGLAEHLLEIKASVSCWAFVSWESYATQLACKSPFIQM